MSNSNSLIDAIGAPLVDASAKPPPDPVPGEQWQFKHDPVGKQLSLEVAVQVPNPDYLPGTILRNYVSVIDPSTIQTLIIWLAKAKADLTKK